MLALILAGGEGSRLRLGEKALVMVHERPMIAWVLDAFCDAGCEPVVVTSYKTPFTPTGLSIWTPREPDMWRTSPRRWR